MLLEPQNHHEIQIQASLLQDDERPRGEKPKHTSRQPAPTASLRSVAVLPHLATSHLTSLSQTQETAKPVSVVSLWSSPKTSPADPETREQNKLQLYKAIMSRNGLLHSKRQLIQVPRESPVSSQ